MLLRREATGDERRVPVPPQDVGDLALGEIAPEHLASILDFRGEVLRQLADDVVLLVPWQEEPDGVQVPVEEGHRGDSASNPVRDASMARHSASNWTSMAAPAGDSR